MRPALGGRDAEEQRGKVWVWVNAMPDSWRRIVVVRSQMGLSKNEWCSGGFTPSSLFSTLCYFSFDWRIFLG